MACRQRGPRAWMCWQFSMSPRCSAVERSVRRVATTAEVEASALPDLILDAVVRSGYQLVSSPVTLPSQGLRYHFEAVGQPSLMSSSSRRLSLPSLEASAWTLSMASVLSEGKTLKAHSKAKIRRRKVLKLLQSSAAVECLQQRCVHPSWRRIMLSHRFLPRARLPKKDCTAAGATTHLNGSELALLQDQDDDASFARVLKALSKF